MTTTTSPTRVDRRPASVYATVGVLVVLGVSALGGGAALIFGGEIRPPDAWLDEIPLASNWVVPGLVLGLGFGVGSLITAYGVLRTPTWPSLTFAERATGHHWSWIATLAIGVGQLIWIGYELVFLPELSFLQAVFGAVGALLVALPLSAPVRRQLRRTG